MIKIGTYQAAYKDNRWEYEPVSNLCQDIDPVSDSSNYGSSDEGSKEQENPYCQEQEELVLIPRRNPRSLRRGYQRSLIQNKIDIEISKDKIFFIEHIYEGLTHTKWYLVQVDMNQSNPVSMKNYGVYCCRWYIRQYKDCNKYPLFFSSPNHYCLSIYQL